MNCRKRARRIISIVGGTIALFIMTMLSAVNSAHAVFPGATWDYSTPEAQNVDSSLLEAAVDYLESLPAPDKSTELVIIRNGYVIWQGTNVTNQHGVYSVTKSIMSLVFGLLVEDQQVTLDTRARSVDANLSNSYPDVRMKHFLTMTSGYQAMGDEDGNYCHGSSDTPFDPGPPLFTPPGSLFAYWDSAANEMGLLVTKLAGQSMHELFQNRIGSAIGLAANAWDWGDFGQVDGLPVNGGAGNYGNHVKISAIEIARIGHMVLNRGNWDGIQVIDSEWIDEATKVQVPKTLPDIGLCGEYLEASGTYGYFWWVNGVRPDGQRLWPGATPGTFAAYGARNNLMFVVPEWNMVIVRLGHDSGVGGATTITDGQWSEFLALIGEAVDAPPSDCELDARFQGGTLAEGATYYTDMSFTLTSVPPDYIGLALIKTPHADRLLTSPSGYMTFQMAEAGQVYVAYDTRGASLPDWMNGFIDTGDELLTSWWRQPAMKIYTKMVDAGTCVNFGANRAPGYSGGNPGNYIVFY